MMDDERNILIFKKAQNEQRPGARQPFTLRLNGHDHGYSKDNVNHPIAAA